LMGRERPELRVGLRSWPTSTAYILYYVPDQDGLILVRVLHHARDIQPLDVFH
jgi:toxin ParE1/3/4